MKEAACRICARELCGNQRRWIFHASAKVNLQVLLSHAVGHELTRDGRREFICSKCAFMLERVYRFDTVVARVEALSLERLQRLLLEKERLRQCISGMYHRNNPEDGPGADPPTRDSPVADLSALRYSDMIQDDLALSVYESWADRDDPGLDRHQHQCAVVAEPVTGQKPRRCRGCAALRVADSDYEAVCKVPRRIGRRSTSCGPPTRGDDPGGPPTQGDDPGGPLTWGDDPERESENAAVKLELPQTGMETDKPTCEKRSPSPGSSVDSLGPEDAQPGRDALWDKLPTDSSFSALETTLGLLRVWEYRPVKTQRGSKLPVLVKSKLDLGLCGGTLDQDPDPPQVMVVAPEVELADMEEEWLDEYLRCGPFRFQQRLMGGQKDWLGCYETAADQCVGELQNVQNQVQSLQAKIRESETRNKKLQNQLVSMELDLRSAREEAQQQERRIQDLSDTVGSKEAEAAELYGVIDEQNQMLHTLRELTNRSQLQGSGPEASWGQNEVLALQASLFQAQLELQATQRAQRRATRTQEDQNRALERLEDDLRGTLEHRRETERHNQELQLALQGIRTALQEREDQLRESEHQRKLEMEERERIVEDLRKSLQAKDQLLQDHQHESQDMKEHRDLLVQKLRQRVKERDRALERAVDEKFRFMEEKEEETLRVRLLLRDKERDLERQRRVLSNNQETITSLEVLVRGKVLELEQVSDACRSIQQQQQNLKDGQNRVLKERDAVIDQLQVALQARTQEAQDLRCSLLSKVHSTPGNVLEELKVRLHLKDRLFQEVLSDRTRQTREHQDQVKDLLGTISSRDRYIQESAGRFSEVVAEQTDRLQELRQQLSSGGGPRPDLTLDLTLELQAVQEELRLVLRKLEENQDLNRTQAVRLDALSRALQAKDDIITDLQNQLVDPSELPLVERLTQEVQNLREILQESTPGPDRSGSGPPEFGEPSSEDEEEELKSYYTESTDGDEFTTQSCGGEQMQSLTGVKHLVEQKLQVEKELVELKVQLEKAGFSSLSQMRKALFSLRAENEDLKLQQSGEQTSLAGDHEEEEELDVTIEEEEERSEAWDGDPSLTQDDVPSGDEEGRKNRNGAEALELLNTCSQGDELSPSLRQKMVGLQQQDKLMVSEHTVQTEDDRDLLTETAVQQDSKQIQVDLQDLGYETCGRSENEAERDDASSPEFDDLEMCTSLDCGSQWWPPRSASQSSSYGEDSSSLRRLVEDLRSQLTRSQVVIRGLQSRIRSLPTASDRGPPTPRKVSWSFQASSSQTGTEDDEGWQSSDGGFQASLQRPGKDLQDLASRVDALEEQLRKDGKKDEDGKTSTWTGKFDTLIQAQARELSHLRQRLREGRGVCSILSQHLGDTTKAFEELLRANDVDFYMGQSFREQLAQSGALAQRIAAKISGRDSSGDPEEKTELIAIRLSKELQQKDLLIESLKAKLRQNHRSDTPCSSHALSDTSDQSDRISYVSDERGSTNEDLELGSDMDAASELGHEDTHTQTSTRVSTDVQCCHGNMSQHPSVPPSITSSLGAQSCLSSSSMHCFGSPHGPVDVQSQTAPVFSSTPFQPPSSHLRPRCQGNMGLGFSLAEVQQELQMLQRQLADASSGFPSSRPLKGFPFTPQQPADFLPMSYPEFQPSPFRSIGTSVPDTSSAMRATVGPLENSALWDTAYGARPARLGPDPSSGSSGYQSGASHTGSDLMKEHLKEIRTLRQRLEDSIRTNDRLRQQLEERLAQTGADKGAPTNIYIQSLDSVGQLSAQVRLLQEENVGLQTQLKKITREGSREAEQLREALSLESSRLKEAELNAERWAGQNRKLQAEAEAHSQEVCQLKQDRQKNQETINRLQHEVSILEQQLCDSCSLVQSLQRDLQTRAREGAANTQSGQDDDARAGHSTTKTKDLRLQLEQQLEQQLQRHLSGRTNAQPGAQYYSDNAPSPPVRDSGLISPSCPLPPVQNQAGQRGAADKASDRVFPSRDGPHALWGGNHLEALQQQVLEGTGIILKMEAAISSLSGSQKPHHQPSDSRCVQKLLTDIRTLKRVLQEAHSLLQLFWKAAQPHPEEPQQEVSLREEVAALQLKLSEREQALKETLDRLRSSNLTKDSMERCILSQLSRTRDVLKTAKTNLQVRTQVSSITSPSLLVGVS